MAPITMAVRRKVVDRARQRLVGTQKRHELTPESGPAGQARLAMAVNPRIPPMTGISLRLPPSRDISRVW